MSAETTYFKGAFACLLLASISLDVASLAAEATLGVLGIHYLFLGIAMGMQITIIFCRFL